MGSGRGYKITYDFGEHEGALTIPTRRPLKSSELPLVVTAGLALRIYAFFGWYLTFRFLGDSVTALPVGITENVTLYGRFGNYAIDYDLGIGEGSRVTLPDGSPAGYSAEDSSRLLFPTWTNA
jgi:hypothetical protein